MFFCIREKVDAGVLAMTQTGQSILHTAPHHDDIMLSYHGAMHLLLGRERDNKVSSSSHVIRQHCEGSTIKEGEESVHNSFFDALSFPTRHDCGVGHSDHYSEREVTMAKHYQHDTGVLGLGEKHGNNVNHFVYLTSGFHSVSRVVYTHFVVTHI